MLLPLPMSAKSSQLWVCLVNSTQDSKSAEPVISLFYFFPSLTILLNIFSQCFHLHVLWSLIIFFSSPFRLLRTPSVTFAESFQNLKLRKEKKLTKTTGRLPLQVSRLVCSNKIKIVDKTPGATYPTHRAFYISSSSSSFRSVIATVKTSCPYVQQKKYNETRHVLKMIQSSKFNKIRTGRSTSSQILKGLLTCNSSIFFPFCLSPRNHLIFLIY